MVIVCCDPDMVPVWKQSMPLYPILDPQRWLVVCVGMWLSSSLVADSTVVWSLERRVCRVGSNYDSSWLQS